MSFLIFLVLFLLVYGGMHVYLYQKFIVLIPRFHWLVTAILIFFVVSPVSIGMAAHFDQVHSIRWIALLVYLWMGFAFLMFFSALVFDATQLIVNNLGPLVGIDTQQWITLNAYNKSLFVFGFALVATIYGGWSARQINIEHVEIVSPKFAGISSPIRIVQISDVHLGMLTNVAWVQQLSDEIISLRPDVLVSTGDLLDMQPNDLDHLLEPLKRVHAQYGKFAVTGNHEGIAGTLASEEMTRRAGFRMLKAERVSIINQLDIAGVDDPFIDPRSVASEAALLKTNPDDRFIILLKHQPRISDEARLYVDLQLSGHIHGGQIVPFNLFTWLTYRVSTGLTQISDRLRLYVSRGTGVWGPPIRFLAKPEITLFELRAEDQ